MKPYNKISIIIPCYNDHLYIEQAVDSAVQQTWPEKEIIVIDDGSNQQTKAKLNFLRSKIDILITQENKGVSSARNVGLNAASGEFILLLDSDDYFESQFCEKAIKILERQPKVKLVTCYAKWFDTTEKFRLYKPKGGDILNFLISNAAIGNSLLRKIDFLKCGGYDEKMVQGFEDWEFYIRLLKDGGYAEVIPEVLFNYRNKHNSRNKKANLARYNIMEYIYNKHSELFKEHFSLFIHEWLKSFKKSESFKQRVMDSIDYKVGNKLLKPLRALGLFRNKSRSLQ